MSAAKRFVVGVDGSEASRSALRWAIDEAATWAAELDVVHAWNPPFMVVPPPMNVNYERDVEDRERAAQRLLDDEISTTTERTSAIPKLIESIVICDSPAGALLETAKGADLLIVGSRGRGGFRGLLLGSVSNQCVRHAPCPVVVFRDPSIDREPAVTRASGLIVVGLDGSEGSDAALRWAIAEAARRSSRLVALAAWSWLDQPGKFDPGYGESDVLAMAKPVVDSARRYVDAGDLVDVEIKAVNDHAAPALIEASADADLLVVGSRGLGGFRGLLLGSVSDQCVHHARCPVVVVRGSHDAADAKSDGERQPGG